MSIFDKLRTSLTRKTKASHQLTSAMEASAAIVRNGHTPLPRTASALLDAYSTHPGLRMVVGRIAQSAAAVNWRLFATTTTGGNGKRSFTRDVRLQRASLDARTKFLGQLADDDSVQEIVDHPFVKMIHRPSDLMTGIQARTLTHAHIELAGEALWVLFRNAQGAADSAIILSPDEVKEIPTATEPTFKVVIGSKQYRIPITEVFWFREVNPADPYGRGSGIATALADELDASEFAAKQVSSFFWNRGMPDFIVSVEGAGKTALQRARREWEQSNQGFRRAYRTKWTGGRVSVERLDTSFKDMNIVELRKFSRKVLTETYGIPPEIVGQIENSNKATIMMAEYIFSKYVLVPRLEALRESFQDFVEREYDARLIVHYDNPVPADRDFVLEAMKAKPEAFRANEWRSIAGASAIDGGDVHLIQSTASSIGRLDDLPDAAESASATEPDADDKPGAKQIDATKDLTEAEINQFLDEFDFGALEEEMQKSMDDLATEFGENQLDDLKIDDAFNLQNPIVQDKMNLLYSDVLPAANKATLGILEPSLLEGIIAGEGTDKLAKRIRSEFATMSRKKSKALAKNSVHLIANAANFAAMDQSNVVSKKQWVTSFVRSRKDHIEAHGQVRDFNADFVVGGHRAKYPHSFGVPSEDMNCGCVVTAVIDDPKSIEALDLLAKDYDSLIGSWEKTVTADVRRALRRQRDGLLDALERFR